MTMLVRPCIQPLDASCERSDSESSAEVASSRMRMGASLIARAIARRLALAAESRLPLWPISVSMPCGSVSTCSSRLAPASTGAHALAVERLAEGATLATMLSLNSTTSWLTSANWRRSACTSQSASAMPSRRSACPRWAR